MELIDKLYVGAQGGLVGGSTANEAGKRSPTARIEDCDTMVFVLIIERDGEMEKGKRNFTCMLASHERMFKNNKECPCNL